MTNLLNMATKFKLKFATDSGKKEVGCLYEGNAGLLHFKGDVDESAKIFFENLSKYNNTEVYKLRKEVDRLNELLEREGK